MDALDGPTELGRLSSTAVFFTAIAGVCAVCARLQGGAYLNFWSPWARTLPWVFGLTGAACVWLALQFMDPRRFVPAFAGALLLPLCLGGFAWGRWLVGTGFSSPSVMLVPLLAAVALILVALSACDVLAVARAPGPSASSATPSSATCWSGSRRRGWPWTRSRRKRSWKRWGREHR